MSDAMLIREATTEDLAAIVGLLLEDELSRSREVAGDVEGYERAFQDISADPRNMLVVVEDAGEVVAFMQVTDIPGLGRKGTERSLVETVHVRSDRQGRRIGRALMTWAIDRARARGCGLVQLTTHKSRADARRFYETLGFVASHEGMKLIL